MPISRQNMTKFVQKSERSIELPLGCRDLIDVGDVRDWKPVTHPDWLTQTTDRLAYIEGYLARLLQSGSSPKVVVISRFQDLGQVMVISDPNIVASVLFAIWHNAAQKQALDGVFEEAGLTPVAEPGRWKSEHSFKYLLPADASAASQLIGEVLRGGYRLGDLSVINLSYHERRAS